MLRYFGKLGKKAETITGGEQEVQEQSPSPYGVFGIVLNGRLLSYHYLQGKDFDQRIP